MSQVNEIVGFNGNELKIRIKGVPEKGKVNQTLLKFLASVLDIPSSSLRLISGTTSKNKKLKIEGMTKEAFDAKLKKHL